VGQVRLERQLVVNEKERTYTDVAANIADVHEPGTSISLCTSQCSLELGCCHQTRERGCPSCAVEEECQIGCDLFKKRLIPGGAYVD
jgi:hypothetical protein